MLEDEYDCTAVMNNGDIHLLTCCPSLNGRIMVGVPFRLRLPALYQYSITGSGLHTYNHQSAIPDIGSPQSTLSAASPLTGLLYSCSISGSAEVLFIHDLVHAMGAATNMNHISCTTRAQFAVRYDLRNSYLCLCLLTSRENVYTPRCLMLQLTRLFALFEETL